MTRLFEIKNKNYGNSFSKQFDEYGLTSVCIRLEDKLNRLKSLNKQISESKNGIVDINVDDESIKDTLIDLANYSVLAIMEISKGDMKITDTEVYGFEASLRGMRNPMNSWHLQDTKRMLGAKGKYNDFKNNDLSYEAIVIGPNDLDLAKRLIKAGNEHCKFLRQIQVWADFEMPLYWWSEFDTYKFNTKNSCSTMHKLFNAKKEIELDDFVYSKEDINILNFIIRELNSLRKRYLETKDFNYVIRGKRLLPTSFKQKRTVNTNYAELINIYNQRKNHRLKEEWQDVFCKWCEELPYFKEFLEAR